MARGSQGWTEERPVSHRRRLAGWVSCVILCTLILPAVNLGVEQAVPDLPPERILSRHEVTSGRLEQAPRHRISASSLASPAIRRSFADRVLPLASAAADGAVVFVPAAGVGSNLRWLDLNFLRGTEAGIRQREPLPSPPVSATPDSGSGSASKSAPWTADRLLADATGMNDEHISLQNSPLSGHLFAVFAAYDLGGSDRDIHIARSMDQGLSWQVWEMPSFAQDEYHPDLAIDSAGYLYAVWIRSDGTIVRTRSAGPENPANWAWVRGLEVGEPCATPAIAVSGAGQFSTVFIAASWLTVNWDFLDYEWTLLWMYSTNGGDTVVYDYLVPDGYQDYWPDVALDGATAYLVNGEADLYTGYMEILLAADAISGGFLYPVSLTGWTDMSCGFPSLAADGPSVYCAYQLDFEDGLGNVDGDIVYCFSWDGLQNVFGPYELVADPAESVGPAIFTTEGRVGCVWLEAPAGGDEFDLVARLASLDGHPDYWQPVETITDQQHVEPAFRSAAGLFHDKVHAAWIDRRDFTTQGLNVYTSDRQVRSDLEPFTPPDWSDPLVAAMSAGERQTGPLAANQPVYVSFAFLNSGLASATGDFQVALTLDAAVVAAWTVSGGLPVGTYATVEDHALMAGPGVHTLGFTVDRLDQLNESHEDNNSWSADFFFLEGDPQLVFVPDHVVHQVPEPAKTHAIVTASETEFALPLRQVVRIPVITNRLQRTLAAATPTQRLRIVIQPATTVDGAALSTLFREPGRAERRPLLLSALKAHAAQVEDALARTTRSLQVQGQMSAPRSLWLNGCLVAEMTPQAITTLAAHADVGRLWLDDLQSTPLAGLPAGGLSRTATQSAEPSEFAAERSLAWHLTRIGADAAWAAGYDGTGVIVGHLDTGAAYDHPDLAGQLWNGSPAYTHHGWDSLDEDDDPYDGDSPYWHGTHTAGLLVGDGTGGTTTGAAPGARLMILRCVPGYYEDMVEALQFGLDHGAQVLTASAGWAEPPEALREANRANAEILLSVGIPWFCAAGNGDHAGGHYPAPHDIVTPADCPHPWYGSGGHAAVITVGASSPLDQVWTESGRGPTAWDQPAPSVYNDYPYPPGLMKPDLVAPGVDITSTFGTAGYYQYSGTSMATPLVAAASAILLQASPDLDPVELGRVLEVSALDLGNPGRDNDAGAGRLDIAGALATLGAEESDGFQVHNLGALPLNITAVTWNASWLEIAPLSAQVAPGDSVPFMARFDPDGLTRGSYHADVLFISNDPASPHTLTVSLIVGDVVDVADGDEALPLPAMSPSVLRNHPNPFNPQTLIRFDTAVPGPVRLDIFDLQGGRVRRLVSEHLPSGAHERSWDGRDDSGRALASGVYLARLAAPHGAVSARKLNLVR